MMKTFFFMFLGCLFGGQAVFSQQTTDEITGRLVNLPPSVNRSLLQMATDQEGFVWLTTNEGIWRFDGTDLKLLDLRKFKLVQNAPAIANLYCYSHFVIISLTHDELHIYDKRTDSCLIYPNFGLINSTCVLHDGNLFFFTPDGQGWTFNDRDHLQKSIDLRRYSGWQPGMMIERIAADAGNQLYIFLHDRVGRIEQNSISWSNSVEIVNSDNRATFTVSGVTFTSRFIAVQYISGQLAIYNKKELSLLKYYPEHPSATMLSVNDHLVMLPLDNNWKEPVPEKNLFKVQRGIFSEYTRLVSPPISTTSGFLLGTTMGLYELTVHHAQSDDIYNQQKLVSFFKNKSIRSIYRAGQKLFVGTYSGLFVCVSDTIRQIPLGFAYTIKRQSDQQLLLGVEGGSGLATLDLQRDSIRFFSKTNLAPDMFTTALFRDKEGWISGDYTALHRIYLKDGTWQVQTIVSDTAAGSFRQIIRVHDKLYVACRKGLYVLDSLKQLQKIYPENSNQLVYCIQPVADGIWIGTHGNGLVKINEQGKVIQHIGFDEGLASNFVYSLALMNDLLIAGTGAGVSIFDLHGSPIPLRVMDDERMNGLATQECNHSALFYDTAAGKVILGGVKGLIFVDARDYSAGANNRNGGLVLSYIKKGGHESQSAKAELFAYMNKTIRLNPSDNNLVLDFAATGSFTQQEGLFRLKGLSDAWQPMQTGQEINFYTLPPGTYTLEAKMPYAVDSKDWFTKIVVVEPAFYQTIWFKALLLLLFLSGVYWLWRSKVKKIEREQQLRSTIASDLHDDIGSTLNSISVYTEIAKQQLVVEEEKTKALLDKMGTASRNMIDTMSDIVWAINPKNDDFEQVLQRMQFFAGELLSGKNILLHFNVDEKIKKLKFRMQERKNIYLIYKEAINNIYKYAAATECTVSIGRNSNFMEMSISDNGKGFNVEERSRSGNGLSNMKNGAKEIGALLDIKSQSPGGTTVYLRINATAVKIRTTQWGSMSPGK